MDILADNRLCALDPPKRNHYFYGKLLDELHLRLEQEYVNRKRWMLSRLALGSGVLCGLQLAKDGKHVLVASGVAIDHYGREIVVPEQVRIDASKISENCQASRDRREDEPSVYLWLCYRECKSDFMPALVSDCRTRECAPSTIVESYCFEVRADGPLADPARDKALCEALSGGNDAEEKRALIHRALQRDCVCGEQHGCIALARIDFDAEGGVTNIDAAQQQRVYGNDMLFKMLLCLQTGGQGPKGDPGETGAEGPRGPQGPPGVGLYPDLPKILDIAWQHNTRYFLGAGANNTAPGSFLQPFWDNSSLASIDVLTKRLIDGVNPPLFSIYFNRPMSGIDDQTFIVRLQFELPLVKQGGLWRPGIYLELPLVGVILQAASGLNALTPNTGEKYAFAASFVPLPEFFTVLLPISLVLLGTASRILEQPSLAIVTLQVKLKGDFIFATGEFNEDRALDGDNIAGLVGVNRTRGAPIAGGKNPSGNLTQGGDFESWLRLALAESLGDGPDMDLPHYELLANAVRNRPEDLPLSINLASAQQLQVAGFTRTQAARIVELRAQQFFTEKADLLARANITPKRLNDIGDRIILL
jgi:hypothetical protein